MKLVYFLQQDSPCCRDHVGVTVPLQSHFIALYGMVLPSGNEPHNWTSHCPFNFLEGFFFLYIYITRYVCVQ